jgi:UDP-2-acetamido-3-amino-2,3-dideoxy-glucuronate N-acetyltransferase
MSLLTSKIAVIGSGYWGKNLIRNYHQLGVLEIICDKNEKILFDFKEQYPNVETCMALSDVLHRKEINGVVIATPAETHYHIAREALLADKHVYVEKPLVLDEKHGEELIDLAEDRKKVLMVGHLLQYHPAFVQLKEMVHSGELGRINYIYSNRLNLGKIRREENILWSFAPHDISMILSLAGEPASSVSAVGGFYLHKKIADVTTTHLEFPSGLQSHIFVSWLHPFKEQKLVVVGDQKMAVFDDTLPWSDKLLLFSHKIKWQRGMPVPSKAEPERVEIKQGEPLRVECEHFLYCLNNGSEPVTDGKEGLQVLKILTAAQRSLDSDGCKVSLQTTDINTIVQQSYDQTSQSSIDHVSIPYLVHETAVIDQNCKIGSGSKIWHFSHILSDSDIGEKCNIGQNVSIGPDVKIGNNCKIQNNVSVYKGVTLEDGVFCGPSMVFTNIYNPRAEISKMDQVRPTLVKHGATLGANCTIICGVTIGRYAFVGAGAVVTQNVPDHAMVAGNTARTIGWACTCGERLTDDYECQACGRYFVQTDKGLKEKL